MGKPAPPDVLSALGPNRWDEECDILVLFLLFLQEQAGSVGSLMGQMSPCQISNTNTCSLWSRHFALALEVCLIQYF